MRAGCIGSRPRQRQSPRLSRATRQRKRARRFVDEERCGTCRAPMEVTRLCAPHYPGRRRRYTITTETTFPSLGASHGHLTMTVQSENWAQCCCATPFATTDRVAACAFHENLTSASRCPSRVAARRTIATPRPRGPLQMSPCTLHGLRRRWRITAKSVMRLTRI